MKPYNPILFSPEAEPEALLDVNAVPLHDTDDVELLASGDAAAARAFNTYGLGVLKDAISCDVTEVRNGEYELVMEYPMTGVHFDEIEQRCIILALANDTDDPQAFRIYQISKAINGVITVNAEHIQYDLSGVPVLPFTAQSCSAACSGLISHAAIPTVFTINTQIGTIADFKVDVPSSVRSWYGGKDGSLLDIYGGEWKYDNYTATLKQERGTDRGVVIKYGVNLIDVKQEANIADVWTGVLPFWHDNDNKNLIRAKIINIRGNFEYRRILCLDLSQDFQDKPTVAELTEKAKEYIKNNDIGVPKVNLTVDWFQSDEIVELCDTVTIEFERLGISVKAKCVKATWDVLKGRYSKLEFGDVKTNIADTIYEMQTEEEKAKSTVSMSMIRAIMDATAMITGNEGGYVVFRDADGDGYPDEILVMNTPDIETATSVWRWNKSGLGFSSSGYSGTYGLALTSDGAIVADRITTGLMSADRIRGGALALGGYGNGNGIAQIYDETGNLAVTLNKTGMVIDRAYTFYASDYSQSDVTTVQNILLGTVTPTAAQVNKYDLDGDGIITGSDLLRVNKLVNGQEDSYTIDAGLVVGSTSTATIIETSGVHIRPRGLYADYSGIKYLYADQIRPLSSNSTDGIYIAGAVWGITTLNSVPVERASGSSWNTGTLYLGAGISSASKQILCYIPSAIPITASRATVSSITGFNVRHIGSGYAYARSGSGTTYTQLNGATIWSNSASYRTNEVSSVTATIRGNDGVTLSIVFVNALTIGQNTTALTNNAPVFIQLSATILFS